MKAIWTVSGQRLKAAQPQEWHVEPMEISPQQIRINKMNRQDETAFTHYTEIADAKQIDVRRMQAEMALSILRVIGGTLGKVFKRSPHCEGVRALDQA